MALLEAATASLVWAPSLLDESKKLLEALAAASAALDEASSSFRLSAASEKENAARAVDLLWIGALWFGAWRPTAASGSTARNRMATSRDDSYVWKLPTIASEAHRSLNWMAAYLLG